MTFARQDPHAAPRFEHPTPATPGRAQCRRRSIKPQAVGMSAPASGATPVHFWQRPWLGVLSRSLAAILGGYALAASTGTLMSLALPMARSQAVVTGMLTAIVVCACAALWAFAVRTAWKAWWGIATPALLMTIATLLLRGTP